MMRRFGQDDAAACRVAAKTTDLMSFIYKHMDLLKFNEKDVKSPESVTYHVPCHLKNTFVSAERLLQQLPGIHYVQAADSTDCCGGGGTFFYEYPELSAKMASGKIENARKTGASIWLTDCPVCRINLEGQLEKGDTIVMKHPATYLESLLQK